MQYLAARANAENREQLYQYHISNVLCMIAENTARFVGDGGKYSTKTFYEIISKPPVEEKRSGREIITELASKIGLEVIDDGST